jgi:hypothetical protein
MTRLVIVGALLFASLANGDKGPACTRRCQEVKAEFDKQCRQNAANKPAALSSCAMVVKGLEAQCQQECSGQKPKKGQTP